MAKKKIVKRSSSSTDSSHDHNSFIMIVGGGFVVVMAIMFLMGKPGSLHQMFGRATTPTEAISPIEVTQVKEHAVSIKEYAYSEQTLTVKVGEKVTWTNDDAVAHTATADDATFDTGSIEPGLSSSVTFDKAGTYTYHCTPHPGMTATIIVEE